MTRPTASVFLMRTHEPLGKSGWADCGAAIETAGSAKTQSQLKANTKNRGRIYACSIATTEKDCCVYLLAAPVWKYQNRTDWAPPT